MLICDGTSSATSKYHQCLCQTTVRPSRCGLNGNRVLKASKPVRGLGATAVAIGRPYVYPDNLPRVNAHGGPEGRPGCWQDVDRELWPAPYLVMDTGASIAPYNDIELGQPLFIDYVWGRQVGESTINP